jgi:hypothetical protein
LIDPASLELLNHLARHIDDAAIALLVAYRTSGGWAGWRDLANTVEIVLPPLDRAAIEAQVADLLELKDRQLPLAVQALMTRMASGTVGATSADSSAFETYWGNPFFTGERFRALIDSGVLARDEAGHWQVTRPIESIEMPDTIHGVIMSRIDRLPEPARRILQVASVIGRAFDVDVLQAVQGSPGENAESLQRHLQDLALGVLPASDLCRMNRRREFLCLPQRHHAGSGLWQPALRTTPRVASPYWRVYRRPPALADDLSGLLTYHYFEGQLWDKAALCFRGGAKRAGKVCECRCGRRVSARAASRRVALAATQGGAASCA